MALSSTAGSGFPVGYEPDPMNQMQTHTTGGQQGGGYNSASAISQLFARLSQEIEEKQPKNCIHFIVDFLCKHYPEHLHGFASIWQMDPDLERERHEVVNFFKAHKISTAVAAHFTNAGYDTLDTLTTLSPDSLVDVEAFNNVKWLPGHKVRLQQIFGEISARVRAYKQHEQQQAHSPRNNGIGGRRYVPQHLAGNPSHQLGGLGIAASGAHLVQQQGSSVLRPAVVSALSHQVSPSSGVPAPHSLAPPAVYSTAHHAPGAAVSGLQALNGTPAGALGAAVAHQHHHHHHAIGGAPTALTTGLGQGGSIFQQQVGNSPYPLA